ncbi:MAG: hypothetical protein AAGB19_04775 [Cyanobacteria bacterium P01_F01_bin.3]
MVLLGTSQSTPLRLQKIARCSVCTVGVVFAIAASSHANPIYPDSPSAPAFDAASTQQNDALIEHVAGNVLDAAIALEVEAAADRAGLERLRARLLSPTTAVASSVNLASGTYFYGEQPIADQPETAYFVFESQGTSITGALFMASSSFDCVTGRIVNQRMSLSVTDSYSQETYPYALTLSKPLVEIASQSSTISLPLSIEGFYPLPLREQDRAILATCQAI